MKFILLFALFATVLSVPLDSEWTSFKTKFNKTYKDAGEEVQRYQIFTRNMKKVNEHNERAKNGLHSYTLGMNKFADLTSEEFSKTHLGFKNNQKISAPRLHQRGDVSALPESVDWRKKGIVTKVKDQGNCGSCWAFSAVASMEGAHAQATGKLVELSEQNLVDCSGPEGNDGCEGGLIDYAFNYTIVNGGIDTEDSYPYIGQDGACKFKKSSIGMTIKSFANIPTNDEDALVDAVAQRVVSVAIDAAGFDFQMYQGGVYTESCGPNPQLNHGVTVVGYGDDTGEDYWLVKNSWGSDWGESGYIRMFRGINICGIAAEASYPDV